MLNSLDLLLYVVLSCVALFLLATAVITCRDFRRQLARKHLVKSDFINYFVGRGKSELLVDSVYGRLTEGRWFKFEPLPTDEIIKVYGIDGSDFDELIIDLVKANHLKPPPNGFLPILTVEDLIDLLSELPSDAHTPQQNLSEPI